MSPDWAGPVVCPIRSDLVLTQARVGARVRTSINQSINRSPINQSINHQSINQSIIHQSIKQPINQHSITIKWATGLGPLSLFSAGPGPLQEHPSLASSSPASAFCNKHSSVHLPPVWPCLTRPWAAGRGPRGPRRVFQSARVPDQNAPTLPTRRGDLSLCHHGLRRRLPPSRVSAGLNPHGCWPPDARSLVLLI